jgi:type IV pilus assembly protein PilV
MCGGRPSAGFTLLEVLVALFVVALGVAGAAGVQAMAVRAAGEAARLADGAQLAASLAQRMRANPVAMALPDAANPYLQFDLDAATTTATAATGPVSPCFGAASCSPEQLARFDVYETAAALASRFPGGRMRVCRDAQDPGPAGLLAWSCTGGVEAPITIKLGWRGRPGEAHSPDAPAVFLTLGAGTP